MGDDAGAYRDTVAEITKVVDSMAKPRGTKEAPARTCKHLADAYPELEDGEYWIDPNVGTSKDALLVNCKMATGETCIIPKPDMIRQDALHRFGSGHVWLSNMDHGSLLTYKMDKVQLNFLQMLSESASQQITLGCFNTVGYYDNRNVTSDRAVKLRSANDNELSPHRGTKFSYDVLSDSCQTFGQWGETVYQVTSSRSQRLPIIDVAAYVNERDTSQEFSLSVGEVCFH
jgi:hypothetical protein